ncbi:MAG TPA: hypothetical protein VG941_01575 [Candidatus Paceibacterota bacterium]|nr:hypothetical protein [Candidatus Paceibacterota bacterium]
MLATAQQKTAESRDALKSVVSWIRRVVAGEELPVPAEVANVVRLAERSSKVLYWIFATARSTAPATRKAMIAEGDHLRKNALDVLARVRGPVSELRELAESSFPPRGIIAASENLHRAVSQLEQALEKADQDRRYLIG